MNIVTAVVAILLIIVLVGSALADFKKSPQVMEMMAQLKIPAKTVPVLGAIKIAGAIGLVIGFPIAQFGVFVGICLFTYFAIAAVTHTRVKAPLKEAVPALTLAGVCVLYVLVTMAK